jgi:heme exporter protein A
MTMGKNIGSTSERLIAADLACRRGGRMVFEGLSFDVGAGDYLHLKGKNGSGKSTLLRLIAGLLPAYSGTLSWGAEDIGGAHISGTRAAQTGLMIYSGHQHGLKPVLTLRENSKGLYQLMTGAHLSDDTLEAAADGFGLLGLIDQPLKYFSSGQTHRAALLRFLLLDRPLWLMDEPTVGLDSENRVRLQALMQAHQQGGGMIIAASHDPIGLVGQSLDLGDFPASKVHLEHWL